MAAVDNGNTGRECSFSSSMQNKEWEEWTKTQKARHNSWECDLPPTKMTLKLAALFLTDGTAAPSNKTPKAEPTGQAKYWGAVSVQEHACGEAAQMRGISVIFRVQNEHICLRLGFRETHTEMGYYWGETPQGSEGNRKLQDIDSQCEQEAQMLPWGEPRPGHLFRRFLCETRCWVITSPNGPVYCYWWWFQGHIIHLDLSFVFR